MVAFVGNIISFTVKLHTNLHLNIPTLRQSLDAKPIYASDGILNVHASISTILDLFICD
jgi:hypothetical protein